VLKTVEARRSNIILRHQRDRLRQFVRVFNEAAELFARVDRELPRCMYMWKSSISIKSDH
jgi:hypothetical protein